MTWTTVNVFTDKADKRAEKEKLQKVEQERMNREEEMRELALRLRRKYV